MPLILLLPLMTTTLIHSIVDQDVDVVLGGVPNHSFLYQQESQGDILDDDLDDNDDNNDDDNHFGVEYNATVYDGGKNTVAAVHLSRLSDRKSVV